MHPLLAGRDRLVSRSRPGFSASAFLAAIALVVSLVGLAVLQQKAQDPGGPEEAVSSAASYIGKSGIPEPPASFGLTRTVDKNRPGVNRYAWEARGPISEEDARSLFDVYISGARAKGWNLQSKQDPFGTGDWSLGWARGGRTAFVQLSVSRGRLTVAICAPQFYC